QILDGDNIRSGINNNLSFTEADRLENIRRIAEVSKLLVDSGVITINSFISPTEEIREMAKSIIGAENFIEVFVNTPIEVCEQRDVKGLYEKARRGEIKNFTGIDSPFDAPAHPDIELHTHQCTIEESVQQCLEVILPRIEYKK
ncbi:MAG: adenylyl-sulfate kinase, partial [Bacteroidales bacterium]|nr:adenylyl-sulfate kinase [Bacteroidales bacterium]